MLKTLFFSAGFLSLLASANANERQSDVEALQRLGSEYALGFHLGDSERMIATTHRDLSKRGVARVGPDGVEVLTWLEGDMLRFMGGNYDLEDQFDESTQRNVNVFSVSGDVAALELIAGDWYDEFTAIRTPDGWRILDCVWGVLNEYEPAAQDAGEAARLAALMREFVEASGVGDDAKLSRLLHPQSQIRQVGASGELSAYTRDQVFRGLGSIGGPLSVEVFNVTSRTAVGRVEHAGSSYWLQALSVGGEWRIVNVLLNG